MTTSTPHTERHRSSRRGFTLSEVLMATTLSVFVLAAVISTFLFIGRTGFNASSYSEMEAEARRGLELFAEDARMANDLRWTSSQCLTLIRTVDGVSTETTYAYDPDPQSATYRCFYRVAGGDPLAAGRQVLIHDITSDFSFRRYKLEQSGALDAVATNDLETKQIQLTLRAVRGTQGAAASNAVVSARYVLRNKRVSR